MQGLVNGFSEFSVRKEFGIWKFRNLWNNFWRNYGRISLMDIEDLEMVEGVEERLTRYIRLRYVYGFC